MCIDHILILGEWLVEVWLICCWSFRLPFIFITIYRFVYVQLAHFSIDDWKNISTAHLIVIIKSEVCLRCLLHHNLLIIAYTFRENREFVFIIFVQFMMSANSRMRFGLKIVFVYLYIIPSHYHHYANLSEDIEVIKCLWDIFCRVCKIRHILSVIHYTICGAVCFQLTHFPCDDWDSIYILCLIIIIKSEVWTITHWLGLGHEQWCALYVFLYSYWHHRIHPVRFVVRWKYFRAPRFQTYGKCKNKILQLNFRHRIKLHP